MSDFNSSFWPIFISVVTLVGILACLLLLWSTSKARVSADGDGTTGHVWDGDLRELNNPLPRWWVGLFVLTCIFGLVYLVLYPGLGSYQGVLNWTQEGQFEREVDRGNAQSAPVYAAFADLSTEELAGNAQAMAIGDRLFMNNCAQCHGSDARGSKGFPDLTNAHWAWGGTPEQIHETIARGRTGVMPPMGAAFESEDDMADIAQYVLSLSGAKHDARRAALGKENFATCAACHGADGKGMPALGSRDLTSGVFVDGPVAEAHIVQIIRDGRTGVMPPWEHKFTPEQLRVLTAYVWGQGGGQPAEEAAAADETGQGS